MSSSEWIIPVVTAVASVGTTGGAFVAWLSRKTRRDRELEQQKHGTEIDQLKIDVTKDVVILLREELARKADQAMKDDLALQKYETAVGWLRRRVVRLENWAMVCLATHPDLPPLPSEEGENPYA